MNATPAPRVEEARFERRDALVEHVADTVVGHLREGIDERGGASLVVSGGRAPPPLFRALSGRPLAWDRVCITLADERWVAPTADEANERLVREHLLTGAAAAVRFVPLKTEAPTPEAGQAECQRRLSTVARPFDLVLLGMGNDGHTASLFPDAPELPQLLAPAAGVLCGAANPASGAQPRMSLTVPCLLDARRILLLVPGADKWTTYRRARGAGAVADMPVRAVLRQDRVPVTVCWAP